MAYHPTKGVQFDGHERKGVLVSKRAYLDTLQMCDIRTCFFHLLHLIAH